MLAYEIRFARFGEGPLRPDPKIAVFIEEQPKLCAEILIAAVIREMPTTRCIVSHSLRCTREWICTACLRDYGVWDSSMITSGYLRKLGSSRSTAPIETIL